MDYLVKLGQQKVIEETDLPSLVERLKLVEKPNVTFSQNSIGTLFGFIKKYKKDLIPGYLLFACFVFIGIFSPLLLNKVITHIEAKNFGLELWSEAILLAISGVVAGISVQHYFNKTLSVYQLITNDLNQEIFFKTMKLSLDEKVKNPVGDIVNYMGSDVEVVADYPIVLADLVWIFTTIIGVSILLISYLGLSAVPSIIILISLIPVTRIVAKKIMHFDDIMMKERDRRINLMSQVLSAIRLIKYFVWEKAILAEVSEVRDQEIKARTKLAMSEIYVSLIYLIFSSLVLFLAFYIHALRGKELTTALIFTCLALFNPLVDAFAHLSRSLSRYLQAFVSIARIKSFLELGEIPRSQLEKTLNTEKLIFKLSKAQIKYNKNNPKPVLENIDFQVSEGESVAIVGPVGSGKTSLLYAILGECEIEGSHLSYINDKKVAFVPQEAFILNSTLLENILFGIKNVSKELLRRSIQLASLSKDISGFKAGLKTEIGEKGINLSGGQKQRVALARCVVSNPDIILLDDPLSAVDVNTEKELVEKLLFGYWKDKTRVVVTHRLEHIEKFDRIYFVLNGQIKAQGKFNELKESSNEFKSFYENFDSEINHLKEEEDKVLPQKEFQEAEEDHRITKDEDREIGAVKKQIYFQYFASMVGFIDSQKVSFWGYFKLFMLIASSFFAASIPLLQNAWMSKFSVWQISYGTEKVVLVFGLIGFLSVLIGLINQTYWLYSGINAGQFLHRKMLRAVVYSKIRFFDSTPIGRILQRFSRDIESVDIQLQYGIEGFTQIVFNVFVALVLILTVLPVMFFVIIPVFYFYFLIQKKYRQSAREVKRLDSIARSPRFAHFKETLIGLVVIRAFKNQDWFYEQFKSKLEHSQRMFYAHFRLNRWFSSRIPIIGGMISLFTILAVVVATQNAYITVGVAALVILYSQNFWGNLNWGIRIFADIESRMTSVERIRFMAELPAEKNLVFEEPILKKEWNGQIDFKSASLKYDLSLPLVLNHLNMHIPAKSKVGIIGRTGSGKSSLFQSLYGFLELVDGDILIDQISIKTLPTQYLRKILSIVPQDPTLFIGTLRENLDRYNEFSDEKIFEALSDVGLIDFVKGQEEGLSLKISESGHNLSQGQRQLVCLARALLLDSKIVLLDEATASVDVETDLKIQKVVSERLKDKTVLIIAHRLGTVQSCDLIIQIESGAVLNSWKQKELSLEKLEELKELI